MVLSNTRKICGGIAQYCHKVGIRWLLQSKTKYDLVSHKTKCIHFWIDQVTKEPEHIHILIWFFSCMSILFAFGWPNLYPMPRLYNSTTTDCKKIERLQLASFQDKHDVNESYRFTIPPCKAMNLATYNLLI